LADTEIIDFLEFDGSYSTEKIANFANSISSAIERSPQNASFQFTNNKVTLFRPAVDGVVLDTDLFTEKVVEALETLEKSEEKISLVIPVKKKAPDITTESVNNLGIKELIGRGYSTFKGSIAGRIHNVVLASSKISGVLIKPGEIFSFNKTLGDVSAATGFQQAYIIKEGRTVLGDGGGVCQVSSTLFRAALDAGLPIEERWPHSYRVSYYEQGFGPGLDATVFDPSYDLKFRNDTPGHILIQAYTDTNNLKLTFELYGTNDGRISVISPPKIWSETPPPPDLYQDDPTLPVGTVKQVDWKAWGAKVSFDYKVTRGTEVLQQKTFYSNYSPWRAIFLKGTRQ
jgi:vancomycin resistance protein YoaR